jgi:sodium-coupled neutral amino acid transporter 11
VNTIVGAGIIGIPYAFKQSGLIIGLLLLGFVGYLTDKSLRIMIDMAAFHPKLKGHNVKTFERLASIPFGPVGRSFILVNMFVMAYGAMVAYLLIIKDTVPTLIFNITGDPHTGFQRELVLIGTSLVIILPLSMFRVSIFEHNQIRKKSFTLNPISISSCFLFLKDMSSLSFTSTLSVTADILLVFFILIFSPVTETVGKMGGFTQVIEDDSIKPGLFIGLGVLSTAMACQHSAFIISDSLYQLTRRRWSIVTICSISMATVLCAILGTTGYLGFMEETQGDVLNNFDADSLVANVARGLLAFTMFFTVSGLIALCKNRPYGYFYSSDM